MLDAIRYPLVFELFAFSKVRVSRSIDGEENLCCRKLKQIRKRYCKKSFDHYNAIPSLNNFDCHPKLRSDPVFESCEKVKFCSHLFLAREAFTDSQMQVVMGVTRVRGSYDKAS
jgi:hypothetical protein